MSGFLGNVGDRYQQRKDRLEERREGRHEQHDRRGHQDDYDGYDSHGSQRRGQRPYGDDDDDRRRPQSYGSQGQERGYGPPSGPPPSARGASALGSLGGLDRGDFASDEDINRMVAAGEFDERRGSGRQGQGRGYGETPGGGGYGGTPGGERRDAYGRYDAPTGSPPGQGYGQRANEHGRYDEPSGVPPGQGYGDRANDYGRYAPSGAPPGRGNQSYQPSYGSGGADLPGYGGGPDRPNQYGPPQTQGRTQYESPQGTPFSQGRESDRPNQYGQPQTQGRSQYESSQGPPLGQGRESDRPNRYGQPQTQGRSQYESPQGPSLGQGNAPGGGFTASRDGEDKYSSGYGGPNETPRRGEAASYYNQQSAPGQGDRYAHLAGMAQGDDDPEPYRRATQGLQEKIQSQAKSRPQKRDDEDDDYKAHVDAHRKAYADDDDGPMDNDAIGAAAAMEAFKQTAASKAPAGGFLAGKAGGGSSKPGRAAESDEEEGETASRAGASGGMQDKLMSLAMSQAGKLFDKKNAGSNGGGKSEDKAQAMQSAAATAMQLFAQYQTKGKLDSSDMSKVMGLAMKML